MAAPPGPDEVEFLFAMHRSPQAIAAREKRAAGFDTTRSWIDPNGARLSDRVWDARQVTRQAIDDVVRETIRTGSDALQAAKLLEAYLLPEQRPMRDLAGKLIRNQPARIVTAFPDARLLGNKTPGKGSYPARRLMRTEITRAHGQATIATAKLSPLALGVKWNLSGSHPKPDTCDLNAERDSGMGPGVYPARNVPRYPNHPHDLCNLSTWYERDPAKRRARIDQLRREYGLVVDGKPPLPLPDGSPDWQVRMHPDDAAAWVADSGYTDTLYHFGTAEKIASLKEIGFVRPAKLNAMLPELPRSTFFTVNPEGGLATGALSEEARVAVKIKVNKVLRINKPKDFYDQMDELGIFDLPDDEWQDTLIKLGYDAVRIEQPGPGKDPWVMLLSKESPREQIVVLDDTMAKLTARKADDAARLVESKAPKAPLEWKPTVSRKEGLEWSRHSSVKEVLYHGTTNEGAKGIMESGFDLTRRSWGRVWGDGVYMTPSRELAEEYAHHSGNILSLRVRTKKTLDIAIDPTTLGVNTKRAVINALPKQDQQGAEAYWEFFRNKNRKEIDRLNGEIREGRRNGTLTGAQIYDLTQQVTLLSNDGAVIRPVLQKYGYDSVYIRSENTIDSVGGTQLVVFDPKQVVVVK